MGELKSLNEKLARMSDEINFRVMKSALDFYGTDIVTMNVRAPWYKRIVGVKTIKRKFHVEHPRMIRVTDA